MRMIVNGEICQCWNDEISALAVFLLNLQYRYLQITEVRYCETSKEMSSSYCGLATFCLFEAGVPKFDTEPLPPSSCGLYSVHCTLRQFLGL
jgi:hypothetical protein